MQAPDKRSHEVSLTLKVVRHCLFKKDDYLLSRQVSVGSLPDSLHGLDLLPNPTFKVFLNLSTSDLRKDPPTTFAALTLLQSSRTTTNKHYTCSPLLGFIELPSVEIPLCVHSQPMLPPTFGLPLLRGKSRSALVVSHHLDSLLHTKLAGLLHPALNRGVRYVSTLIQPASTRETGREKNFPATHFTPPEEYPSSAAVSCHHDRYPHAVVESRLNTKAFNNNSLSTSRSYSTDELAMLPHRFQHNNTRSFHGLCSPSRSSIRRFAQDESCSKIPSLSSQWCLASETPQPKPKP